MDTSSEPNTVISARQALRLDNSVPAEVWHIHRLDRANADYDLISFGEHDSPVGIAAVTVNDNVVTHSAHLPGSRPQLTIDTQKAIALAGLSELAETDLVWQPSDISRSPFYPFWRVREAEHTRYVDQEGRVWDNLSLSQRGG